MALPISMNDGPILIERQLRRVPVITRPEFVGDDAQRSTATAACDAQ
jgi:hypothetical protein